MNRQNIQILCNSINKNINQISLKYNIARVYACVCVYEWLCAHDSKWNQF